MSRWIVAAGLSGVVLSAGVAAALATEPRTSSDADSDALTEAHREARRAQVENLIRASGEPFTDPDVDMVLEAEARFSQEPQVGPPAIGYEPFAIINVREGDQ